MSDLVKDANANFMVDAEASRIIIGGGQNIKVVEFISMFSF